MTIKQQVSALEGISMKPLQKEPGLYFTVQGDYNDGDYISEEYMVKSQAITKTLHHLQNGDLSEYSPSGNPDATEYHDLEIIEIYIIDNDFQTYEIFM